MAELEIREFAKSCGQMQSGREMLLFDTDAKAHRMANSTATGEGLLSNGHMGADLIRLEAGTGFIPHTHPGDHLLFVVAGRSTITYDGVIQEVTAGNCYMVPGEVPHAVGAITDVTILAIGSPHKPVESPSRMKPTAYQEVLAETGDLLCTICDMIARGDNFLHDLSCKHCPCRRCNGA